MTHSNTSRARLKAAARQVVRGSTESTRSQTIKADTQVNQAIQRLRRFIRIAKAVQKNSEADHSFDDAAFKKNYYRPLYDAWKQEVWPYIRSLPTVAGGEAITNHIFNMGIVPNVHYAKDWFDSNIQQAEYIIDLLNRANKPFKMPDLSVQARTALLYAYMPTNIQRGVLVQDKNKQFVDELKRAALATIKDDRFYITKKGMEAAAWLYDNDMDARRLLSSGGVRSTKVGRWQVGKGQAQAYAQSMAGRTAGQSTGGSDRDFISHTYTASGLEQFLKARQRGEIKITKIDDRAGNGGKQDTVVYYTFLQHPCDLEWFQQAHPEVCG